MSNPASQRLQLASQREQQNSSCWQAQESGHPYALSVPMRADAQGSHAASSVQSVQSVRFYLQWAGG